MTKFKALVVTSEYWRPDENYLEAIVERTKGKIADGDFLVISEKAISTATNNIVDESKVNPRLSARLIARYWVPLFWGFFLGPACHLKPRLLNHLREYPKDAGSRHKQVALQHASFLQTLMFGSEGGIDGSNLPYSYVSLPLKNALNVCERIGERLLQKSGKNVCVLIVDTDKTYSLGNFHFTPRSTCVEGIHCCGGFMVYVIGRMFKLKRRATPIAVAGCRVSAETALEIAQTANRARGFGAGRTVWDMVEKFGVSLTSVTWEMLETVKHKPIVIVRKRERRKELWNPLLSS